jgi:hypothetical protein
VILRLEAENLGGDVLDGVEELTVTSEEQRSVGAGQLDLDVGTGGRVLDRDEGDCSNWD